METGFGYSYALTILFEHKARNVPGPFSDISGHPRGEMPVLLPSASCVLEDPVWTLRCSPYSAGPAQGLQRNRVKWEFCAWLTVPQRQCFTLSLQLLCRSRSPVTPRESLAPSCQKAQILSVILFAFLFSWEFCVSLSFSIKFHCYVFLSYFSP